MKITGVRTWCLRAPLEQPFAFSQGWVHTRAATLVEISTDAGHTGWGESICMGLQPPEIAAAAVDHALKPLLLGADPRDLEVLWHRMYHHTRDYGRTGAMMGAISGVDIALWDIAGKALGVPVHRLLGGAFRERVQAYATGFYRVRGQGEAPRLADEARRHREAGFGAMKVKLGFGIEDDLAVMRAIGRELEGSGTTLMIDTNHGYGPADAIRLGRALDDMKLRWYEEPVVPEDLAGYRRVRDALDTPVAGGENAHSLFGFRDLFDAGAVDIVQPDLCCAGGFAASRHIVALAHAHGVQVNPHVWGSAIGQAASLQWIASIPVAHHGLFADEPIFEYDTSAHPFRGELVAEPVLQRGGWIDLPKRPGIGVEVNRKVLERYAGG
ncbi:MAG TPA: mandelate racemase/muconate lactonizing enzyme family protein [Burkholderiales bacterium]